MTEERRVVTSEPVDTTVPAAERVPSETIVERQPATRTIVQDDPVGNAYAASQLIQTIVWSIVVLVLLIVALWALHVYAHLF
ncbi:MAG: hypothetical protein NVS2B16_08700 [Chloroflexota bacterium]